LLAAGAGVAVGRLVAGALTGASEGALGRALPGALGATGFLATFLVLAWGLRSDELLMVLGPLSRRLGKKPAA